MKVTHGLGMAVKEYLLTGHPITRLEALIFFGVSNLTDVISELRKQVYIIKSKSVPFASAVVRVNQMATLIPPEDLPIREIHRVWLLINVEF